jgi:hypothetical protein
LDKPSPRADVLPLPQRQLWPELVVVQNEAFVLYGGTAVALFLGHRESVDFDFFTHQQFQPEDLLSKFRFLSGAEVLQSQSDTLTVLIRPVVDEEDSVKVSFFGGLTFGRLEDPQSTVDGVLQVASPQDLLAHKLKVLLRTLRQSLSAGQNSRINRMKRRFQHRRSLWIVRWRSIRQSDALIFTTTSRFTYR